MRALATCCLCCGAARTPRTHAALLALLPLVHRTRTRLPARASPGPACGRLERPWLAHGRPCPQLGGLANGPANNHGHKYAPRGGKQPTNDERRRKDAARPRTHRRRRQSMRHGNTGPPPRQRGVRLVRCSFHASVAHTATTRPSSQGPASALRFNYCAQRAPPPPGGSVISNREACTNPRSWWSDKRPWTDGKVRSEIMTHLVLKFVVPHKGESQILRRVHNKKAGVHTLVSVHHPGPCVVRCVFIERGFTPMPPLARLARFCARERRCARSAPEKRPKHARWA